MPRKKKAKLTLTCTCGNTCDFKATSNEERQVFGGKEKIQVGSAEGFTVDVIHPVGHQVEFICKNCGTIWRFVRTQEG
jgi:RNase P subunit RPR2